MIVIGLTGSIAMGKSTTAEIFASLGIPVFDSDAEVHRYYSKGGEAVAAISAAFPVAVVDGEVDRNRLSEIVLADPAALKRLEAIVHPIVRKHEENFLMKCRRQNHPVAVLDIPLLFESGREKDVDRIVVVSAPAEMQRARALSRPGMTAEKFDRMLQRQVPDSEKRKMANFVVDTSLGRENALAQVKDIIAKIQIESRDERP